MVGCVGRIAELFLEIDDDVDLEKVKQMIG